MRNVRIAFAVAFVSILVLLGWAGWKIISVKGESAHVNQVVSVQITEGEHASVDREQDRRIYGTEGEGPSGNRNSSEAVTENGEERRLTRTVDLWSSRGGISSLDGEAEQEVKEDRLVRCMFVRDEKLKSGQRVTLRLLEDAVVGGVVILRDSHVSALCTIRDRLYLTVSSVEMNGWIRSLGLAVYDTDGSRGIYCPSVDTSAARTARDEALNIGQSALRGSVGNIASSVLRTGAGIIRSSSGNTMTVTVPSGYTIYLMKEEKR